MPENGVVLGAIRAFYGRPIPPETVDSMVRDVADRRSVSSGYRAGVIRVPMCLPGTVATYGWRHSGTDWCHSGTNPYIRGYLMALLLVISSMDLVASPPRYREQADFLSCAKHKATHSLAEDAG